METRDMKWIQYWRHRRIDVVKAVFPLRLRVALRGERNRNTIGVSISLATQRAAGNKP